MIYKSRFANFSILALLLFSLSSSLLELESDYEFPIHAHRHELNMCIFFNIMKTWMHVESKEIFKMTCDETYILFLSESHLESKACRPLKVEHLLVAFQCTNMMSLQMHSQLPNMVPIVARGHHKPKMWEISLTWSTSCDCDKDMINTQGLFISKHRIRSTNHPSL